MGVALAAAAAILMTGACASNIRSNDQDPSVPRPLNGIAVTLDVGDQRFAVGAFTAPLVIVRTGHHIAWATPSLAPRNVFLHDEDGSGSSGSGYVLLVNAMGSQDYEYVLKFGKGLRALNLQH